MQYRKCWLLCPPAVAGLIGLGLASADLRPPAALAQQAQETSQVSDSPEIGCYERAKLKSHMGEGSAFLLCRDAKSSAPALCYEAGLKQTNLASTSLFELCRCSGSLAPIECFVRARSQTFLPSAQILRLCSAVVIENLWPNCTPVDASK